MIRIVANIIIPLENKGFMNLKEFHVVCHLINISKNVQLAIFYNTWGEIIMIILILIIISKI